jgi:hypothetical protein
MVDEMVVDEVLCESSDSSSSELGKHRKRIALDELAAQLLEADLEKNYYPKAIAKYEAFVHTYYPYVESNLTEAPNAIFAFILEACGDKELGFKGRGASTVDTLRAACRRYYTVKRNCETGWRKTGTVDEDGIEQWTGHPSDSPYLSRAIKGLKKNIVH